MPADFCVKNIKNGIIVQQTYWVKHVRLAELSLEVSRTSQNHSCHVNFIVGHKQLDSRLSHFSHIVVSLLHSKSSETQGRLPSSAWNTQKKILSGLCVPKSTGIYEILPARCETSKKQTKNNLNVT